MFKKDPFLVDKNKLNDCLYNINSFSKEKVNSFSN